MASRNGFTAAGELIILAGYSLMLALMIQSGRPMVELLDATRQDFELSVTAYHRARMANALRALRDKRTEEEILSIEKINCTHCGSSHALPHCDHCDCELPRDSLNVFINNISMSSAAIEHTQPPATRDAGMTIGGRSAITLCYNCARRGVDLVAIILNSGQFQEQRERTV